ncbi:hypothetical protein [Aeromonas veronii]|uniref:hypothetical protein n=1 Tax=Aeromonas veronii TaxID=654 RepID=UPI0032ED3BE0
MVFPGIISRLHPDSDPSSLPRQLHQGQQSRAEAFWLPASLQSEAASVLAALSDKSSLYLEQPAAVPLRSHDGVLQEDGSLLLGNGHRMTLACEMGDGGIVPEQALGEMTAWLEAGHFHFICSAAIQPVARAILNIWPLDPYLARHFLLSFTPLQCEATEADYLAVFAARELGTTSENSWVQAYLKLEKKLHRAYLDH